MVADSSHFIFLCRWNTQRIFLNTLIPHGPQKLRIIKEHLLSQATVHLLMKSSVVVAQIPVVGVVAATAVVVAGAGAEDVEVGEHLSRVKM